MPLRTNDPLPQCLQRSSVTGTSSLRDMSGDVSAGGFTELTLDPAEGRGKTRVGGDRDGASGCLPGLRRGGADQVRPRLRPAALAGERVRPGGFPPPPPPPTRPG